VAPAAGFEPAFSRL